MLASPQNSLLTPKKQSLLQFPVQNKVSVITVFYEAQGSINQINLDAQGLSTSSCILLAVQKLSSDKGLDLTQDCDQYQLFAAKKNGKRKTDLPAIEHQQELMKTGFRRFFLNPLYKLPALETKDSLTSIKSQILMNGKKQKETFDITMTETSKANSFFGCFCIKKNH